MELLVGDLGLQVDAAPLLGVVHPTEAGDVDHTLLVHIHIAGCGPRKQRVRLGIWAQTTTSLGVLAAGAQVKTSCPLT